MMRKSALTTAIALALCAGAYAQDQPSLPKNDNEKLVPKLTVHGEAQLERPADQLRLSLGVTTQSAEAAQAMQDNSRIMNEVVAALDKAGLKKDEYQTGRFQVRPMYSQRHQPQGEWQPKITGYQVVNTVHIKSKQIELAGQFIQAATDAGANNVDSIGFDLADPRKHRAEAIKEATGNAMADAKALAEASGQRLVRVLTVNLDHAPVPMPMYQQGMDRMMAAEAVAAPPPISPGDVTVHASVMIVYEVAALN